MKFPKFKKPKRIITEISVNCFVCGRVYLHRLEPKYNFEKYESSWKCQKCGRDWQNNHELHVFADDAEKLGYFYCFACHKKCDLKDEDFPVCNNCFTKMEEEAEILRKLRDLPSKNQI